jgi:hypothetical protein
MSGEPSGQDRAWAFASARYWDDRYSSRLARPPSRSHAEPDGDDPATFDWLATYAAVQPWVAPALCGARVALDIGCGNAQFARDVCEAHPQLTLLAVDYSAMLFEGLFARVGAGALGPPERAAPAVMDARALAVRDARCEPPYPQGRRFPEPNS